MFERRKISNPFDGRIEPFEIINGVYFVGTFQASSHLINTGDGLILIDTGYKNTLYLLIDSIYKLGFKPTDVKYIINTHWHWDHVEATKAFSQLSGAKTLIGANDYENAKKYFLADIKINDGDILSLGNVNVKFLETPGHTKGTISFFFDVNFEGKTYRVGSFGGAGANTLAKGCFDFDGCREAYLNSIERLKKEHVDVFLGNHTWNNDTLNKSIEIQKGNKYAFVDSSLWNKFLDFCKNRLEQIIKSEN